MSKGQRQRNARRVAWRPNAGPQTSLLTCPADDLLFGGGRGGGKTDGTLGKSIQHCEEYGEHARVLYVRKTFPQLRDVIRRSHTLFRAAGATWAATPKRWTFPAGGTVTFGYLDREDAAEEYQGHENTLVIVDEAGNFPAPTWIDPLRATLRADATLNIRLQFILTANPGGPGHAWLKRRYVDPSPQGVPFRADVGGETLWRVFLPSLLADNPYRSNDPTYVARLRAATAGRPGLERAWINGDWNVALAGKLIKRAVLDGLPRYRVRPEFVAIYLSLDTAQKAKEQNDHSAIGVYGQTAEGHIYMLHKAARRVEMPALLDWMKDAAAEHDPAAVLVEDKANGAAAMQMLNVDPDWRWPLIEIVPTSKESKATRMAVELPWFVSGRLHAPEWAPWWEAFELQALQFDGTDGAEDDQVDETSQMLRWLRTGGASVDALNEW